MEVMVISHLTILCAGVALGMYISSQIERHIDKNIKKR